MKSEPFWSDVHWQTFVFTWFALQIILHRNHLFIVIGLWAWLTDKNFFLRRQQINVAEKSFTDVIRFSGLVCRVAQDDPILIKYAPSFQDMTFFERDTFPDNRVYFLLLLKQSSNQLNRDLSQYYVRICIQNRQLIIDRGNLCEIIILHTKLFNLLQVLNFNLNPDQTRYFLH